MILRLIVGDSDLTERFERTYLKGFHMREIGQEGRVELKKGKRVCMGENKGFSILLAVNNKVGYSPSNSVAQYSLVISCCMDLKIVLSEFRYVF